MALPLPTEIAADARRRLEMPLVITGEAQHKVRGAGVGIGFYPGRCLGRRAGEVVTKTEIIDEVWDMAYDGDVNIVEVYVRALRQRVDLPFGRQSIQTVRGAGYRLVGDHA